MATSTTTPETMSAIQNIPFSIDLLHQCPREIRMKIWGYYFGNPIIPDATKQNILEAFRASRPKPEGPVVVFAEYQETLQCFYEVRLCHLRDDTVELSQVSLNFPTDANGKVQQNLLCFLDLSGSTLGYLRYLKIELSNV